MKLEAHIVNEEAIRRLIRQREFSLLMLYGFELMSLDIQRGIVYYSWAYKATDRVSFSQLSISYDELTVVLLDAWPCSLVLNAGDTLHINYSLEWRADNWDDDDVTLPIPPDVSISFNFCLCA